MGSQGVVQTISGKTAKEAYRKAFDQARYESGSGGYSGTIAESDGFFTEAARCGHEAKARADQALQDGTVQKWGSSLVIPITPIVGGRTIQIEVVVTGLDHQQAKAAAENAVRAKLRAGEAIDSIEVRDANTHVSGGPNATLRTKIVTTTGKGVQVKEYVVDDGHTLSKLPIFPTLAEAKTYAEQQMEHNRWTDSLSITARVRKESGPLVEYKRVEVRRTAAVIAKVGRPSAEAPTEYLAVGWYSC